MAAAIRPERDDVWDDLGGEPRELGDEDCGEARAVSAFVTDVAAGFGDCVDIRRPDPAHVWPAVCRESRAGTKEHGVYASTVSTEAN